MSHKFSSDNEELFFSMFEYAPISLWIEDFSGIRKRVDELKANGVDDLSQYLDSHPEEVVYCAGLAKVVYVNQATINLYEAVDEQDLLGKLSRIFNDNSYQHFKEEIIALSAGEHSIEVQLTNATLTGKNMLVRLELRIAPGYEDSWARVFVSVFDVTEETQTVKALAESEELFRKFFEYASIGMVIADLDGNFLRVNQTLCKLLGYTERELLSKKFVDVTHPDDQEKDFSRVTQLINDEMAYFQLEKRYLPKKGGPIWAVLNASLTRDAAGNPLRYIGQIQDISERKRIEQELEDQIRFLETLIDTIPNPVFYKDLKGRYLGCNQSFLDMFAVGKDEILGKNNFELPELVPLELAHKYHEREIELVRSPGILTYESSIELPNHTTLEFMVSKTVFFDHNNKAAGVVGVMLDISERKRYEEKLKKLANTDSLTGIFNRRHFYDLAAREWERTQRNEHIISVIMVDIDHFKSVNDTFGHMAGDKVLQVIAWNFMKNVRKVDMVARYGGEEFVFLLPDTEEEEAKQIAERLRQTVEEMGVRVDDDKIKVTISAGLASTADPGCISLDVLIDRADQAVYVAKDAGRNRVAVWQKKE